MKMDEDRLEESGLVEQRKGKYSSEEQAMTFKWNADGMKLKCNEGHSCNSLQVQLVV